MNAGRGYMAYFSAYGGMIGFLCLLVVFIDNFSFERGGCRLRRF
jgi:hypothetical protein